MKLFLEGGYEKTTTANIAQAAGMAPSSFFAAFENKEALLYTLTESMFESQFDNAEKLIGEQRGSASGVCGGNGASDVYHRAF